MIRESALVFGREHRLVGIVTEPARSGAETTVILLNAGLVHRIGPRRIHVALARQLAARGLRVLRMDLSGIGDSESRKDDLSAVEGVLADVREAMDALGERCGARAFVLAGICSGAKVAFQAALRDRRVVGTLLIDPGDFGNGAEASLASGDSAFVQHYVRQYWRSVFSKGIDRKRIVGWFTGKANLGYACRVFKTQFRGLFKSRGEARATRERLLAEFDALAGRGVRMLLLHSGRGASRDFHDMMLAKSLPGRAAARLVTTQVLHDTSHTFVTLASQAELVHAARVWCRTWEPAEVAAAPTRTGTPGTWPTPVEAGAPLVDSGGRIGG